MVEIFGMQFVASALGKAMLAGIATFLAAIAIALIVYVVKMGMEERADVRKMESMRRRREEALRRNRDWRR